MGKVKEQEENNEMLEGMPEKKKLTKFQKKRLPEILAVFGKHNFYANGLTPLELRTTLEDMGPTYVKIGQIMSSRVDMLPEAYCKELGKLRSNVKPLDPALARQVIEEETGKKIEEIYSEFRDEPLGSASIGQVHYAVLKDGTQVVTKVQRPKIADMMREDLVLLRKLASLLSAVSDSDEEGSVDLQEVIDENNKSMIGRKVKVLAEEVSKNDPSMISGRTETNHLVHFVADASLIGQIVDVEIEESMTFYFAGRLL